MATTRTPEKGKKLNIMEGDSKDRRKTFTTLHISKENDQTKESEDDNCKDCDIFIRKGIQCESCESWFHPECQNIPAEEYQFLERSENITSVWYCKQCKKEMAQLIKMGKKLNKDFSKLTLYEEENKNLRNENEVLKRENENMKGRVTYIEREINEIKGGMEVSKNEPGTAAMMTMLKEVIQSFKEEASRDRRFVIEEISKIKEDRDIMKREMSEMVTNQMKEILDERSRIEERKREEEKEEREIREKQNSLIVFNVREPREEVVGRDREEEEYRNIDEIFGRGVGVRGFNIMDLRRLGNKSEGKIRPLYVKLEKREQKWDIVRNAKNLSKAPLPMRKIGIVPDLTFKQREKDRELRDRLKEKKDRGEKGWFISRGELKKRDEQEDGEQEGAEQEGAEQEGAVGGF